MLRPELGRITNSGNIFESGSTFLPPTMLKHQTRSFLYLTSCNFAVDFFEPRSYTKFHEVFFMSDFVDKAFLRMFDGNRGLRLPSVLWPTVLTVANFHKGLFQKSYLPEFGIRIAR
jgi:hypothetical protein